MKEKRGVEEKCEIVGLLAKLGKSNLIPLLLLAIGVNIYGFPMCPYSCKVKLCFASGATVPLSMQLAEQWL